MRTSFFWTVIGQPILDRLNLIVFFIMTSKFSWPLRPALTNTWYSLRSLISGLVCDCVITSKRHVAHCTRICRPATSPTISTICCEMVAHDDFCFNMVLLNYTISYICSLSRLLYNLYSFLDDVIVVRYNVFTLWSFLILCYFSLLEFTDFLHFIIIPFSSFPSVSMCSWAVMKFF